MVPSMAQIENKIVDNSIDVTDHARLGLVCGGRRRERSSLVGSKPCGERAVSGRSWHRGRRHQPSFMEGMCKQAQVVRRHSSAAPTRQASCGVQWAAASCRSTGSAAGRALCASPTVSEVSREACGSVNLGVVGVP